MSRLYRGNPGSKNDGWKFVGHVGELENSDWVAYSKNQPSGGEWIYIKLSSLGDVPYKANYWMSWNGERFAKGGDIFKLLEHRPELHKMVCDFMNKKRKNQCPKKPATHATSAHRTQALPTVTADGCRRFTPTPNPTTPDGCGHGSLIPPSRSIASAGSGKDEVGRTGTRTVFFH